MKKLLALLKAIVAFVAHPVESIKNGYRGMVFRHYERASEVQSDRSVILSIKENIADAKLDMARAQTEEDEYSRRFYAEEAVKEIEEAISDCKNLIEIDEAHHFYGIIGRPQLVKWLALPTVALACLSVWIGIEIASAVGLRDSYFCQFLFSLVVEVALAIPVIYFVTRKLFQGILAIKISNLEMLHGRIVGVRNEVFAEN